MPQTALRRGAGIDREHGAGNASRFVAEQEFDGVRDMLTEQSQQGVAQLALKRRNSSMHAVGLLRHIGR